jgi:hypothetical protein
MAAVLARDTYTTYFELQKRRAQARPGREAGLSERARLVPLPICPLCLTFWLNLLI